MILIPGSKELSFLKRGGIEEGDFQFGDFPKGILPVGVQDEAEDTSQYQDVLDSHLAGGQGQIHYLRHHDKDLVDPEKVKQALTIWTHRYNEIYQNFMTMHQILSGIHGTIQQRQEYKTKRAYYVDMINRIYYGMQTAELKLVKCNEVIWQVGDSMKNELRLDMRFVSKLMMANSVGEEALDVQKQVLKEQIKLARKTNSPFLARFAQVVEDEDTIFVAIMELTSHFIDLVDEIYGIAMDMEGDLSSAPVEMSKAARFFKKAQAEEQVPTPPTAGDAPPPSQQMPPINPFQIGQAQGQGMVGGVPKPLPVDENEFIRLKFPQITRIPKSNWDKILLAGQGGQEGKPHLININYTKTYGVEEGITKTYVVEPYSFRMRRGRYFFFGYHVNDGHIKQFNYRAINDVEILDETFEPRWEVELSYLG